MNENIKAIFYDDDDLDVEETWFNTICEKVYDFYWIKIGWRVKELFRSINNLIRWFPVIVKDRNWDGNYIFYILKFKLLTQAKYIADRDRHMSSQKDARNMRICAKLIDKITEEFYSSEYQDYSVETLEFIKCDIPNRKQLVTNRVSEHFDDYFKKYPLVYKKIMSDPKLQLFKINIDDDSVADNKQRIAMNMGHYNHNRVNKLLFSIMENNIANWWE